MGLDVVMLGSPSLKAMKADPSVEPELRMVIQYCVKQFPEAREVDIKDPAAIVKGGHRIGGYSDLHILRGLAVAMDRSPDAVSGLAESDLESIAESFYASGNPDTDYPHLIHHPDDSGFYVPFALPAPFVIQGVPPGYDEKVSITFGSSVGLLDELDRLNQALALPGDLGEVGEEAFATLADQHRWPTAAQVWGVLRLYARESVERPGFIQFC